MNDVIGNLLPPESILYTWRTREDHDNLTKLASTITNVDLDSDFLGLTWEQIQNLNNDKNIQIEQKVVPNNFSISFTDDPKVRTPYQILYLPGKISLKINANDPTLKNYLTIENGTANLINSGKALTSIGSIVLDATNNMVVRRNIMNGKTSALDINAFNEYIFNLNASRQSLAGNIFSRITSGIQALKPE